MVATLAEGAVPFFGEMGGLLPEFSSLVKSLIYRIPGDSIRDQTLSPMVEGHDLPSPLKGSRFHSPSQKGHKNAELPGFTSLNIYKMCSTSLLDFWVKPLTVISPKDII